MVFPLRYQIAELQSRMEKINSAKTSCLWLRAKRSGRGLGLGQDDRTGKERMK